MKILAIDPGKDGGIAYIKDGIVSAFRMPIGGKDIDYAAIGQVVRDIQPDLAVIEKVNAGVFTASDGEKRTMGVTSAFTFGGAFYGPIWMMAGLGIPTEIVHPKTWKASVLRDTPKDKAAAIDYCRRVFPTVPLIPPRCRKPHDGIADALCILSYAQRTWGREQEVA